MKKYITGKIVILLAITLVAAVLSLGAGSVHLSVRDVCTALLSRFSFVDVPVDEATRTIVWDFRFGRTLLAGFAGASLAVAGALFQGLFRNPLADPFVIGASSGASLGAAIAIALRLTSPLPFLSPVPFAAFCGAVLAVSLAYLISGSGGDLPKSISLLLTGTALSSLFSAGVSLLLTIKERDLHQVFFWLLGGFGGRGFRELSMLLPAFVIGFILALIVSRPLDVLSSGDEAARSLGLDLKRVQFLVVLSASLLTAAAVSVSGIIGFVGLAAPHVARLIFGPEHRRLIPMSALVGACLLMAADDLARTVIAPIELPVGVITALLGAPFFLYLLRSKRKPLGDV
ncbi:MAG TPA: iron ABC transporter permease [Spirochaetia bacterium]|nr:iron ABC transporter permease [Spirochaetia bacterium]